MVHEADGVGVGDRAVEPADRRAAEPEPRDAQAGPPERDALERLVRHLGALRVRRSVDGVQNASVSFNQSATGQYTERSEGFAARLGPAGSDAPVLGVQAGRPLAAGIGPRSRTGRRRWTSPAAAGPTAARRRSARRADPDRIAGDGRPARRGRAPRPGRPPRQGRGDRAQLPRARRTRRASTPPPAPLIFAKWPSSIIGPGADIRWDPALTTQVDYEAELARRHRARGAPRVGGRRPRPRPRLHLPQRRLGARPPVRRRPVDARQVARHVLPDGPGARDRRRDRRPAGAGHRVPRQRRGPAAAPAPPQMFFGVAEIISHCSRRSRSSPATSSRPGRRAASGSSATRRSCWPTATSSRSRSRASARSRNTCRHEPSRGRPRAAAAVT